MDCFVISPIGTDGSEVRAKADQVLEYIIKDALTPLGYEVCRADTISESGIITTQVIERIVESDLVVADLTGHNANVFYELAIRHIVKKPFVQLIEDGESLPFDVASSRTVFYSLDLPGARRASEEVRRQATAIATDDARVENPISVAIDLNALSESQNPTETAISRIESEITKIRYSLERIEDSDRKPNVVSNAILDDVLGTHLTDEKTSSIWTDDNVVLLKEMWSEGHSAAQIAKEIGGVTRNGVIGKIHRLGLKSRNGHAE